MSSQGLGTWLFREMMPLRRRTSRLVVSLYGGGLGKLLEGWLLLLTTRGRRSGRLHTTPVSYVPGANSSLVYLFRAAPGGADWLANVRAQPKVKVQIGRHSYSGTAIVLRGERDRRQPLECYLRHRSLPARAARRAFGLNAERADGTIARASMRTQPVLISLRLDKIYIR